MKNILRRLPDFFFKRISARGFGVMRAAWALVAFLYMLMQWKDVTNYYSDAGLIPSALVPDALRMGARFTILTWVTSPDAVFGLYLLLLALLAAACVGLFPRLSTVLSVILLFSFHERNPFPLGGGDTVLRCIGFLLCVAPNIETCAVSRIPMQWRHFKKKRTLMADEQVSIWGYRLLLWQFLILYGTSLWFKMLGSMWRNGTAVEAALHHPIFSRLPEWLAHVMTPLTPFVTFGAVFWHFTWLLLLIPEPLRRRLLPRVSLKRWILAGGMLFHGSIFLLMDAGSFSLAVLAGYTGLLLKEDFDAIRARLNRNFRGPIAVLYDGHCGLCLRSVFTLKMIDALRRLRFVDFWDKKQKDAVAPDLKIAQLDKAMHVRFANGKTLKGFDAIREVAWHIPVLWPLTPLMYLPGVAPIGRKAYAKIAIRRKACDHESCGL